MCSRPGDPVLEGFYARICDHLRGWRPISWLEIGSHALAGAIAAHTGSVYELAPGLSIADNVVLKSYRKPPVSRGPLLLLGKIRELAEALMERYDVRASGPDVPARQLSGGNLQKVVLAREFSGDPVVVVAASPTRGLDVAGIEVVHAYLRDAAERGVGVLLISEDLDEIRSLADRIAVMYEGAVVGERDAATATVEELGLLMAGGE